MIFSPKYREDPRCWPFDHGDKQRRNGRKQNVKILFTKSFVFLFNLQKVKKKKLS